MILFLEEIIHLLILAYKDSYPSPISRDFSSVLSNQLNFLLLKNQQISLKVPQGFFFLVQIKPLI
jgi:hypothetical protein